MSNYVNHCLVDTCTHTSTLRTMITVIPGEEGDGFIFLVYILGTTKCAGIEK